MATSSKKPVRKTRAKPTTTRKKPTKRQKSARKNTHLVAWLIVTLIIIIALLSTAIYLLLKDTSPVNTQKSTITQPKTIPDKRAVNTAQNTFSVNYTLKREITAHVMEYLITVNKNGKAFVRIQHESAPIQTATVQQQGNKSVLTIRAVDQVGTESYEELYKYELLGSGRYNIIQ